MGLFFFIRRLEEGSQDYKIVPMHQLYAGGLFAADFFRTKFCNAPRELCSVQVANTDDIAGVEIPFTAGNTRRQQTLAAFSQGLFGASIHEQRAFGMMEKSNPAF